MRQPGRSTAPLCRSHGTDAQEGGFGCATLRHSWLRDKKLCKPILTPWRLQQQHRYHQIPGDLPAERLAGGEGLPLPTPPWAGLRVGHSQTPR